MNQPPQRVSPVLYPKEWALPARPEGPPAALDSHRQSEFQLKPDLRLLAEGMSLQLRVVEATYPAKYRTLPSAAFQLYWSRVFHYLSDSAALLLRGSYVGVPPLVRTACECHAAAAQLGGEEQEVFVDFLSSSLKPDDARHATNIGRGSYHAGGTLATVPLLGGIYRASTELSRPHIGATLLEVAPESNLQKLLVLFGDQSFHFGWAQLELGWLLGLCAVVLDATRAPGSPVATSEELGAAIDGYTDRVATALSAPLRCSIEEIDDHGDRRFLIHNFRRQSSGAARKVVL